MWSGTNIYAKSQRYLIRILLRVHLAPEREQKTIIQHECQQMAKHIRHGKRDEDNEHKYATRVQSCMKRLDRLTSILKELEARKSGIGAKAEKDKDINHVSSNLEPGGGSGRGRRRPKCDGKRHDYVVRILYLQSDKAVVPKGKTVAPTPEEKVKESSATRIRKLEDSVEEALLCNPKINQTRNVSDNEVLKAFYHKSPKSDEIAVIKLITNQLLPYSPLSDSMCLSTQLPFVILANSILIAVGYHDHVQEISPIVSPHNIHATPINPTIMYEILTPHKDGILQGPFEVTPVGTDEAVTSSYATLKNGNFMWCHKIIFANRMVVRRDKMVSILRLIKDGHVPVVSGYETRQKKNRKKKSKGLHVAKEYVEKSLQQLQQQLDHAIENHGTTGDLPINVPSIKPAPERMQHEDVTANIDFHVHLYNQQQEYQQQQLEQIEGLLNLEKAEIIDGSEEKQKVVFISSQLQQQQESDNSNSNNVQEQLQNHQLKKQTRPYNNDNKVTVIVSGLSKLVLIMIRYV
ncbi:hypothetical protein BDC45DRAFT_530444 [Circinella umbellata]|nr:hypothetical protein BDC45DRAFT_530444 [Circinella umbellata]